MFRNFPPGIPRSTPQFIKDSKTKTLCQEMTTVENISFVIFSGTVEIHQINEKKFKKNIFSNDSPRLLHYIADPRVWQALCICNLSFISLFTFFRICYFNNFRALTVFFDRQIIGHKPDQSRGWIKIEKWKNKKAMFSDGNMIISSTQFQSQIRFEWKYVDLFFVCRKKIIFNFEWLHIKFIFDYEIWNWSEFIFSSIEILKILIFLLTLQELQKEISKER